MAGKITRRAVLEYRICDELV